MPHREGRGRPYSLYAIKGYRPEDIVEALQRASKKRTPAYSEVRNITQLILEEYLEPRGLSEISFREIVAVSRERCKGFYSGDIARLVVKELSGEGIKVWR